MASEGPKHNLQLLHELGQSAWLDYIRRGLLDSGEFENMVRSGWIMGVTSNPTIFLKAIAGSHDYDLALKDLRERGVEDPYDAFLTLATEDLRAAADVLRPIYDRAGGQDGFVSFEAQEDTSEVMVAEAKRAVSLIDRPNVMIKVPGTDSGIDATRVLIASGINVNVTLLFDVDVYERVALAYIQGLEDRLRNGLNLDGLASVASFFISRVDTKVDDRLPDTSPLRGRVAVSNAASAYRRFRQLFSGPRWQFLADAGASVQRPLWASTGTKNPSYSDTLYVDELIAPDTVNTMPEATLQAFLDHGRPRLSLAASAEGAHVLQQVAATGVDIHQVGSELLEEGLASFAADFERLTDELRKRLVSTQAPLTTETSAALREGVDRRLTLMAEERIIRRIWACDHTVWKSEPDEITRPSRLGWLTIAGTMLDQIASLRRFAAEVSAEGFTACVLCGMGGSSLAAAILAQTFVRPAGAMKLYVLDTTDPDAIARLGQSLQDTKILFIIASKSGATLETLVHMEYFWAKQPEGRRFVAITDPGSQLEALARKRDFRKVFLNPPDIGGRYSALSYFGLVPAALIGVDIAQLLDSAYEMVHACHYCVPLAQNPGAQLGAFLGEAALADRDKLTLLLPAELGAFGDWVEQLIAESTGKQGGGIVPVVGEKRGDAAAYADDRAFVSLGDQPTADLEAAGHPVFRLPLADRNHLGGQFFLWQFATAVAGQILGINPFDQPNVEEAKAATASLLGARRPLYELSSTKASRLSDLLRPGDYVSLQAYVAQSDEVDTALSRVRTLLRDRFRVATTSGYGPRFLHSTGQLHKGGPDSGIFIQVVSRNANDLAIPGRSFTFAQLKRAQAEGDRKALHSRGRRVISLETGPDPAAEIGNLVDRLL